jgi:hypothetical protein|tara:strand:- start:186 stop:473 length:288 start_codon:yes stop_codon:yes gene_type:complete
MKDTINQYEVRTVDSDHMENFFIIRAKDESGAFDALSSLTHSTYEFVSITLTLEDVPPLDDMSIEEFNKITNSNRCLHISHKNDLDDVRQGKSNE